MIAPITDEQEQNLTFLKQSPQHPFSLRFLDDRIELQFQLERCQRNIKAFFFASSIPMIFCAILLLTFPYNFSHHGPIEENLMAFKMAFNCFIWAWVTAAFGYGFFMKKRKHLGQSWLLCVRIGLFSALIVLPMRFDNPVPLLVFSVQLTASVFSAFFANVPFYWLSFIIGFHLLWIGVVSGIGVVIEPQDMSAFCVQLLFTCLLAGEGYLREKKDRLVHIMWLRMSSELQRAEDVSRYLSVKNAASVASDAESVDDEKVSNQSPLAVAGVFPDFPVNLEVVPRYERGSDFKFLLKTGQFITDQLSIAKKLNKELLKKVEDLAAQIVALSAEPAATPRRSEAATKSAIAKLFKTSSALLLSLNNVTDLELVETGKLVLSRDALDLSGALEAAIVDQQSVLEESNLLVSSMVTGPKKLVGDKFRVKQVISQVLQSAIRCCKPGAEIMVEVSSKEQSLIAKVEIRVVSSARPRDDVFEDAGMVVCGKLCKLMNGQLIIGAPGSQVAGFLVTAELYLPLSNDIPVTRKLCNMECVVRVESPWLQKCLETEMENAGADIARGPGDLSRRKDVIILTDRDVKAMQIVSKLSTCVATDVVLVQREPDEIIETEDLVKEGSSVHILRAPFVTSDIFALLQRHFRKGTLVAEEELHIPGNITAPTLTRNSSFNGTYIQATEPKRRLTQDILAEWTEHDDPSEKQSLP